MSGQARRRTGAGVAARVQGPDLGEGHLPDLASAAGGPVDRLIVHDDDVAIGCRPQVDLDDREPQRHRMAERRQSVLGIPGSHPPVRRDDYLPPRTSHGGSLPAGLSWRTTTSPRSSAAPSRTGTAGMAAPPRTAAVARRQRLGLPGTASDLKLQHEPVIRGIGHRTSSTRHCPPSPRRVRKRADPSGRAG